MCGWIRCGKRGACQRQKREDLGQGQAAFNGECVALSHACSSRTVSGLGARGVAAGVATHVACAAPAPGLGGLAGSRKLS